MWPLVSIRNRNEILAVTYAGERVLKVGGIVSCFALFLGSAAPSFATPVDAARAFAQNCFSPFLTARKAQAAFEDTGARHDFYDLDPFSNVAPTPAFGLRPATRGTDRRCEVSFDGNHAALAVEFATNGLRAEGLNRDVPVPETHKPVPGTELLAARRLNPRKIAVVHVGTRPGPNGTETFMNVERLSPSASQQN